MNTKLWIARDKDGLLKVSKIRPTSQNDFYWFANGESITLKENDFPSVTYSNSPQEIELKMIKP